MGELHCKLELLFGEFAELKLELYKKHSGREILRKRNFLIYASDGVRDLRQLCLRARREFLTASDETQFGQVLLPRLVDGVMTSNWSRLESGLYFGPINGRQVLLAPRTGPDVLNTSSLKSLLQKFRSETGASEGTEYYVGYAYGVVPDGRPRPFNEVAGNEFWEHITGETNFTEVSLILLNQIRSEYRRSMLREIIRIRREMEEILEGVQSPTGEIDWLTCFKRTGALR